MKLVLEVSYKYFPLTELASHKIRLGAASLKDALSFPGCILSDLNISWNLLTPEGGLKLAEGLEVM